MEDWVPHLSIVCTVNQKRLGSTLMFSDDNNYLPRFTSVHGKHLDHLLGNSNLTTLGYFGTLRFSPRSKTLILDNDISQTKLSDSAIEENWNSFFKILNKKLLKKLYRGKRGRRRKELPTLAVVEDHNRFINLSHIHFIMLKPKDITEYNFINTIKKTWANTYYGKVGTPENPMFDIQKIFNRGVIPYLFKEKYLYTPYALHCTNEYKCAI